MLEAHFYSLNDELYDTEQTATLGPFEYLQMTYETLRDQDGQIVAVFDTKQGDWQIAERRPLAGTDWCENVPVGPHFSDMEIRKANDK